METGRSLIPQKTYKGRCNDPSYDNESISVTGIRAGDPQAGSEALYKRPNFRNPD